MKQYFAPTIVVAIVLALAGVLYLRVDRVEIVQMDKTENSVLDERPIVVWSVTQSGSDDSLVYSYSLKTKTTSKPQQYFEGTGVVRFNQSMDLCGQAYAVAKLTFDCAIDEQSVLTMRVGDETEGGRDVGTFVVDPRDLGVTPSAIEGYLVPVAVSDDKRTIYLGRRVETESWVAGLWKLDVATGEVSEISYVRKQNLYQYDINPMTKQLIGVMFTPPDGLGDPLTGPSSIHTVDLSTGKGERIMGGSVEGGLFENPMLSDDGLSYAFFASGPLFGNAQTVIFGPGETAEGGGTEIDGVMKDWFGDTVVFDRDGNLFLYDLKTDTETQLTNETNATVEYLGVVE